MSDTGDQTTAAEAGTPTEAAQTQAAQPANVPQTGISSRGDGWFTRSVRNGAIAAVIVVVAGAFFTIGWFTSTRGEHGHPAIMKGINQRMNLCPGAVPPGGTDQQGSNQWQGRPGRGWGMGAPQQAPPPQQAPSTEQGYLGVGLKTVTPELQEQYGLSRSSGALVATIDGRGPALQAGIRRGDIITSIDGTPVTQQEDVVNTIVKKKAGESVSVAVDRDGQSLTFQVTLAERPASVSG